MTTDAAYHSALASRTRQRLLAVLAESDAPLDAAGIAASVELHLTTVRFHLDQLERAGLVQRETERRPGRGRPRVVFAAVTETADASPQTQLIDALASAVSATGDGQERAVLAGRQWADELAPGESDVLPLATLIDVLDRFGFEPHPDDLGDIRLLACPFRGAARDHPDVVCGVHRGLIERTLDRAGGDASAVRLLPFVQPELCIVAMGR
jgi:predicted ArsR family transcriptional regulator